MRVRLDYSWATARLIPPPLTDLLGYRAMMQDFQACLADPGHQPCSDFHRTRRDLGIVLQAYGHFPH